MHGATLRLPDAGPYAAATADADATVDLWCNDHCDLLAVRGPDRERVVEAVADRAGVGDVTDRGDALLVVTEACLRDAERPAVEPYLAAHGCLHVSPFHYADGAKEVRVLALDAGNLTDCYRALAGDHDVTVVEKHGADAAGRAVAGDAPGSDPLADLTDRQREALRVAREEGYYELPRGTTTAEVADRLGVARRTAEEHLRRAERRLVEAAAGRRL